MSGALAQLISFGAQDTYLTGNPQITFFKNVYKRYTNFSVEPLLVDTPFTTTNPSVSQEITFTVNRVGDLLGKCWLEVNLPNTLNGAAASNFVNWRNNTGHALIEHVILKIGGQEIDKQTGHYLDIYNELDPEGEHEEFGLNKHQSYLYTNNTNGDPTNCPPLKLYIPLKFWFNLNVGSSLPLVALQYHQVEIVVKLRSTNSLIVSDLQQPAISVPNMTVNLWGNFIFLGEQERTKFAKETHEYLITRVQEKVTTVSSTTVSLDEFTMPTKEIFFVFTDVSKAYNCTANICNPTNFTNGTITYPGGVATINAPGPANNTVDDIFRYSASRTLIPANFQNAGRFATDSGMFTYNSNALENFEKFQLMVNAQTERFPAKEASYFRLVTPKQAGYRTPSKHIYYYSFAFDPLSNQPSGSCNFSVISNVNLNFTNDNSNLTGFFGTGQREIRIFAVSYNILRINSGMGGLAFSN